MLDSLETLQAGKGIEPVWPGNGGHAAGGEEGRLTQTTPCTSRASWATMLARPLRMVSGRCRAHQVLGLPGQAVLLTAAGPGQPTGALKVPGSVGRWGPLCLGWRGLAPAGRGRGPLTLVGETGGPSSARAAAGSGGRCAPRWSTGPPCVGGLGFRPEALTFLSKVTSDREHRALS